MKHPGHIEELLSRLITGWTKEKSDGLQQEQREAMIDAMLYCLFADDYDDPMERHVLDKAIAKFSWESNTDIPEYIESASAIVREALASRESEQQLLKDISRRLTNWETRFQAIQFCKILLYSDLFVSNEEVRALAELSAAFKQH